VLIRFQAENFRSIKEAQELSLVASTRSDHAGALIPVERHDFQLLRAAAVYGANASGKSSLFHALAFMRDAVVESQRQWDPSAGVPRSVFALDRNCFTEPSVFAVDVLLDGILYEYGFSVDSARVLEEWLFASPKGRRQEWFTRDATRDVEFVFNRSLPGENRAISALTRPNSLFLSAAAQNNHAVLGPIYNWFSQRLWIVDDTTRGFLERYTTEQCRNDSYRAALIGLLNAADLGVAKIEFREPDLTPEMQDAIQRSEPAVAESLRRTWGAPQVRLWHSTADPFSHVPLSFDQESRGTRTLFSLLGILHWSLATGATLAVDELDQSLHTHLARRVVTMFNQPDENPYGAQLLFNTHDTNLLDTDLLRRDQVWFTEKGYDGATRLVPLTDYHARKHENLERGYLQGRYGAVPALAEMSSDSEAVG
jgi:hypothetical protein